MKLRILLFILSVGALAPFSLFTNADAGCVGGSTGDACIGIRTPSPPPRAYYEPPPPVVVGPRPPVVVEHHHHDHHDVIIERHRDDPDED